MKLEPLTEQMRFAMASELRNTIGALDWLKNSGTPEQRFEATAMLNKLHDHVAILAGSRCTELYAPDDEPAAGAPA